MLLLVLLVALLLYLPNQAQVRVETGVRGLNVANVLFLLALGALMLNHRPSSDATPLKWPLLMFFAALSWALLLALWGDSSAWVEDVTVYKNALFYPLLFFLYFHAVRDLKTVRLLVLLTLLLVLSSGILGLRQALDYGIENYNDAKRVAAPFGWLPGESNRAAAFFCIYLQLVAAAVLFRRSWGPWRWMWGAAFVLGVFVVFHTYSRQAYAILALTMLLLAMRRQVLLGLLAAVALYHYPMWVPQTVVQRIEMTVVDPFEAQASRPAPTEPPGSTGVGGAAGYSERGGARFDESTESRMDLWAGAWELIQQNPAGIGLNRFRREIGPYVPSQHEGKDAHNFYVLLATEAGLVAPLFLIVLLGSLALLGRRMARAADDEESRMLGIGFTMATVAVALTNVYGTRFLDGDVMGNYWILAALVARMALLKERERLIRSQGVSRVGLTAPGSRSPRSSGLRGGVPTQTPNPGSTG